MEAFIPIASNTIVERIVGIESRDPFKEADYVQLAEALRNKRKTALMAGKRMSITVKGKYVNVKPASGEMLPCGSLEVEAVLRHHA